MSLFRFDPNWNLRRHNETQEIVLQAITVPVFGAYYRFGAYWSLHDKKKIDVRPLLRIYKYNCNYLTISRQRRDDYKPIVTEPKANSLFCCICLFPFLKRSVHNISWNHPSKREILARNCACFKLYFVHNNNSSLRPPRQKQVLSTEKQTFLRIFLQNFVN